jgi:signal transduction histidine kinase
MSERLVDERVLIWAAARDAELTRHFLEQDGLIASTAGDCSELCRELDRGAGALVIADELLADPATSMLQERLTLQPAWSDLPVIMVVRAESRESSIKRILEAYGGVSILHRPLSLDTLVSAVRAALRARRKQYEVRDLVSELRATEKRRNEFLAMMAHELRNPLAPIRSHGSHPEKGCPAFCGFSVDGVGRRTQATLDAVSYIHASEPPLAHRLEPRESSLA